MTGVQTCALPISPNAVSVDAFRRSTSSGIGVMPEVLLRHPAVSEVSVVGRPHIEWNEEVAAFVVLRDGTTVEERDLETFRIVRVSWLAAWIFAATCATGLSHADQTATILNRAFAGSTGAGIDLAVATVSVDSVPVAQDKPQVQVSSGVRAIEVLCSTRVFAGMGRVDLNFKTTVSVDLEVGRVYQLDAQVTEQGDCTPQLQLQ